MNEQILSHFQSADEILATVISSIPPFVIEKSDRLFFSLVESIISQQLSIKAGDTIVKRFLVLFPKEQLTPEAVLAVPRETLRSVGMSWNKADYVHNIARALVHKELDFTKFESMTDEEVINLLNRNRKAGELHLRAFSAIDQDMAVLNIEILRGRKPADGGKCSA